MFPILRPSLPQDQAAVLKIWEAASGKAHSFLSAKFQSMERRNIPRIYLAKADTWVALDNGQLLGFISLIDNEVGALFVDPQYHGRKIGQALLNKARFLRGRLAVQVFSKNEKALGFYVAYGFVEAQRSMHKESGQDVVKMELEANFLRDTLNAAIGSGLMAADASGGDI